MDKWWFDLCDDFNQEFWESNVDIRLEL